MQKLSVDKFLGEGRTILDVRSPAEFGQGHIPGAASFPLFSDQERKVIGTIYKQQNKDNAFKEGLKIVGPKMADFVSKAESFGSKELFIYCWRGGMRSGSMGWLLSQADFSVSLLEGGYKQFRAQLLSSFEQPLQLKILSGLTGSGKTEVLKEMRNLGAQVLDLEGIANHQGSSFGNVLSTNQPTTEQFQNNLYKTFWELDHKRPIWLEDESIVIGRVHLPESLFFQMQKSKHYILEVSMQQRLDLLVNDYGHLDLEKLKHATEGISKKLGPQNATRVYEALDNNNLSGAAEILLTYYDRQYNKSFEKKKDRIEGILDGKGLNFTEIAQKIISTYGY